ncbi:teichoic acid D-Ala incorporation-associated protein DltX [Sphingobacterium sp. R2]
MVRVKFILTTVFYFCIVSILVYFLDSSALDRNLCSYS